MQYITTTELRTKASQLVKELKNGSSVTLIHRSKVVGQFRPAQPEPKPFDPEAFDKVINGLNLPQTTSSQREKIYRKHLMDKYDKGLSRR